MKKGLFIPTTTNLFYNMFGANDIANVCRK
jgi:hypothetical protein